MQQHPKTADNQSSILGMPDKIVDAAHNCAFTNQFVIVDLTGSYAEGQKTTERQQHANYIMEIQQRR